jgi:transcriptional regulator with XRE-family HTH domain
MLRAVDARRLGRTLRAIRQDARETQSTVAQRAGVSQSVYSRAERGDIVDLKISTLDRIVAALDAHLILDIRFRGGRADRLIDRAHAAIVEIVVAALSSAGWETAIEFSFNVFGERGSVDVLGWHATTRTLLIAEVKSRFTDLQGMLLSLGRKLRLVPDEVRRELGWDARAVARIVVAPGTTENRSVIERHMSIFASTLPARAPAIRAWIRRPDGPIAGVWLVSRDVLPA